MCRTSTAPNICTSFDSEDFSGEIKDCDEGDLEWIHRGRLLELTLWEGDRIFLRLLETDCPFFSLKLRYEGDHLVQAVLDGGRSCRRQRHEAAGGTGAACC